MHEDLQVYKFHRWLYTLKMKAASSVETLLTAFRTRLCHSTESRNM